MEETTPYKLKCVDGKVMIFDAGVVLGLRREHRVVGALEGSHPANPLQNTYFGLPLVLLPEEAAMLLEKGAIELTGGSLTWPMSEREVAKYKLYRDLHERGFYLTYGLKFGGDYLLYLGEPMRYHSSFVASLLDHSRPFKPRDLVALGRLGTNVKKTRLLCSWDPAANKFTYISLGWSAMG
ncbi:tRNA-intron endonuclease catalytic domain-like protein [Martensiomyces pterosporus]|nr:tRNA-intron endonuclease catalytic domain-like protein [Martensiomyces pterosporus]